MPTRGRGVTLIELLVVAGVIAVILVIAIPAIRSANIGARDTQNLANMRSTHQQFREWGNDHDDRFVNQGPPPPGKEFVLELGPGGGAIVGAGYESQATRWNWPLAAWSHEGVLSWHSVYAPPEDPRGVAEQVAPGFGCAVCVYSPSAFTYAAAMLFDPYWFTAEREARFVARDRAARYVRWSEAAYPSGKGLMIDSARPQDAGADAVVFVDGGAALVMQSTRVDGDSGFTSAPVSRTWKGILGRDYDR